MPGSKAGPARAACMDGEGHVKGVGAARANTLQFRVTLCGVGPAFPREKRAHAVIIPV